MNDLLPDQVKNWQAVEKLVRENFSRAGLNEIRTPLLEATDLFSRGIGESTDVVGKEMYTFTDRGDRSCTLRPEGTASVVRALIQHGLLTQGSQRIWYSGPMFRYERPQAGRQRQFHQIGAEFFGLASERDDAEIISIAWDLLKDLGLQGLNLEINTLGTFDDRKRYRDLLISWLEKRFDLLDNDSQNRIHKNPLRILDTKDPNTRKLLEEAPCLNESLSDETKIRFLSLQKILEGLKIPFSLNNQLVRGLDYYCHTAFEIKTEKLGAQATVCGGGRYDGLVQQLGGPSVASVGWAIGMERLMMLLDDRHLPQFDFDVYCVNRGVDAEVEALSLTRELRAANLSVELDSSGASFAKQFKRANRSNARWAVVIGDEEFNSREVRIKRLISNSKDEHNHEIIIKRSEIQKLIDTLRS